MKAIILAILFGILLVAGCTGNSNPPTNDQDTVQPPPVVIGENTTTPPKPNASIDATYFDLTKEKCEAAKGHWNECGSACRGAPEGTICTLQCVQYCECGGIAGFGCPTGYHCTDYLPSASTPDAMGICKLLAKEYNLTTNITNINVTVKNETTNWTKTEEEREYDGLVFGANKYALVLDDIVIGGNANCAAVGIYDMKTQVFLKNDVLCPNKDYYWTSPEGRSFRMVLLNSAAGYAGQSVWAKVIVYG